MGHETASAPRGAAFRDAAVLVVAARDAARAIAQTLRDAGMRVDAALTRDEALGLIGFYDFDLALVDPLCDGGAGAELIRDLVAASGGPAVAALAAPEDERARALAREAGASACLAPDAPAEAAAALLGPSDAEPGRGAAPDAEPAVGGVDPARFGAHVDREIYEGLAAAIGEEMMDELLTRVRADIAEQRALVAAAAPAADREALRRATHVLISVAGAVGATPLQRMAEELNRLAKQAEDEALRAAAAALTAEADEVLAFIGPR
ncbi:Hpt domain-containing protein [Oceanicella actignis]|uniref:Response regulator receiver domain-containing protein n=1 Tax=Oceanicella actignis TaxID=1189325 RepID=A0A1M7SGQ0_9RHOB|nr:Hpt domain-containing protein [Oceanicella actignis]SET20820.1 Response regulator receiver domain-containing protein [Oceanicella actignis]SHN57655.1 Response regulator receiver domain-containing protein [Oceanicella actignis]